MTKVQYSVIFSSLKVILGLIERFITFMEETGTTPPPAESDTDSITHSSEVERDIPYLLGVLCDTADAIELVCEKLEAEI